MPDSQKRRELILQNLRQYGACSISVLAQQFDVSSMTVRRDLDRMAGAIRMYHGVAVLNNEMSCQAQDYELSNAESVQVEEKQRIAKAAAALIEPNDIVILDGGSTPAILARWIPKGIPLTIICLSLNAFFEVKDNPDAEVIMTGGVYHKATRIFESPESISLLKRYRATKAFISAKGFRADLGVTCSSHYLLSIKQAAINSSVEKILIADSSKYGKVDACFFAELGTFDAIITDGGLPASAADSIRALGIRLSVV